MGAITFVRAAVAVLRKHIMLANMHSDVITVLCLCLATRIFREVALRAESI